jgi:hypothetical protein
MKHLLLALCLVAPASAQDRVTVRGTWRADYDNYWTRSDSERWISLQLRYDDSNSGLGIRERDVPALSDRRAEGPVRFTLARDAGRFEFTGEVHDGRGRGDFTFAPSGDFISSMSRLGYSRLSDQDVWRFAMHDVTRDYVTDFKNAGYQLDTSDLIKTRIHGATPAFAREMKQETNTRLEIDQLVKLRIHGVTPEFIKAMRDLGFKNETIDDFVKFRIHGVTPEFIKAWTDLGYKNLDGDDYVKMRIHGVTPQFVRELSDLGYKNLPIEDLVRMRIHGVTPDYIRKMKELGYPNIKIDRLVQFRIHGVDEDLIRRARAHGFNDLSADDLVDLAIHGRRWLRGDEKQEEGQKEDAKNEDGKRRREGDEGNEGTE